MVQIAKLLTPHEREKKLLPIILDSIKDEEDEERRMSGLILIDELCEILGPSVC